MQNIIISGFSGIGKSTASRLDSSRIVDFESSHYSKLEDGSRNPEWPSNYVDAIAKEYMEGENKVILTSCHSEVRELFHAYELPFLIVVPNITCRNEYMIRWFSRGSSVKFMADMYKNWFTYVNSCVNDGAPCIILEKDEYLAQLLNRMKVEALR